MRRLLKKITSVSFEKASLKDWAHIFPELQIAEIHSTLSHIFLKNEMPASSRKTILLVAYCLTHPAELRHLRTKIVGIQHSINSLNV